MNLWDLDDDTVAVFRQGCDLVLEQLGKQRKEVEKAPGLAHAPRMLELIATQTGVAFNAKRLLMDQADLEAEASARRRPRQEHDDEAQTANTQSVDEALDEAERIAKENRRARAWTALESVLPAIDGDLRMQLKAEDEAEREAAKEKLRELINGAWLDVVHRDEEGKEWPHLKLVEETQGEDGTATTVWCVMHPDPLAFFYDIAAPDEFNALEAIPDFKGDALLEAAVVALTEEEEPAAEPLVVYISAKGDTVTDPESGQDYLLSHALEEGFRVIPIGQWHGEYRRNPDDAFEWRTAEEAAAEETPAVAEAGEESNIPDYDAPVEPIVADNEPSGPELVRDEPKKRRGRKQQEEEPVAG